METSTIIKESTRKRDKTDKANKNKPEDNRDNIDDINNPRTQKSKGKASHPDQVKNSKKGKRTLEHVIMLECQKILHWNQTLKTKIF